MQSKVNYLARLLAKRELLINQLQIIDDEINRSWQGSGRLDTPGKRGPKFKYTDKDVTLVKRLSKQGLTERAIAAKTGIPHSTVGYLLNA